MSQKDRFRATPAATGSTPALYATIRDQIIRAIQLGTYAPGAMLPTNAQIQEKWGVSHTTSRRVLAELAEAGWAQFLGTRGYIATAGPAPVNPDPTGPDPEPALTGHPGIPPPPYPAPPAPASPLPARPAHTVPLDGDIPDQFTAVTAIQAAIEPAPADVAHALRLHGPGTPIHVRRRIITDGASTTPLEIRTSYTIHVPEGPITRTDPIPECWHQALNAHTVHTVTATASTINARHPTPYEGATLRVPPHAIVLVRATTHHSELGPPIDLTVSVWPAETTTIHAPQHPIT
ncbi:GntR family transcriptional regulator [Spirillospora sp. CA-255316]